MIVSDKKRLLAEIAQVQALLAELPQDAAIGRLSLESRIEELKQELNGLPCRIEPARAILTFQGRPVVGSKGIFADFASQATTAFTELVSVLAAAQVGPVSSNGPVPYRDDTQLLITGTAIGSFGFELQENVTQGSFTELDSSVADAIQKSSSLFSGVIENSDETLTELISELDTRAVKNFRKFLTVLKNNDAICTLSFKDQQVGFRDVSQVRNAVDRIAEDNVHESVEKFYGKFDGVLPHRRNFEFITQPNEEVITGKIGPEVSEPERINQHLEESVHIEVRTFRVGSGRKRYVLEKLPAWA